MNRITGFLLLPAIVGAILISVPGGLAAYEVWVIDQSDSKDGTTLGGNLYVFSGTDDQFSNGTAVSINTT